MYLNIAAGVAAIGRYSSQCEDAGTTLLFQVDSFPIDSPEANLFEADWLQDKDGANTFDKSGHPTKQSR